MTTETFNTTTEKLAAMAMVWDENNDTSVEWEMRNMCQAAIA